MQESKVCHFEAEVTQVLRLVVNSLYRNQEIFLRELLSNASDALDRLRFRALSEPELLSEATALKIRVIPDSDRGTLTIWDNGVGMSAEELEKDLGTVARSGSREFLARAAEGQSSGLQLIGQFGVGFYSAFLVADQVEVVSRAAGTDPAHRWVSDGRETFTVEPAEREERGTSVILRLKEDQRQYLQKPHLRHLVERHSDYLGHPIELPVEGDAAKFEVVNHSSALWQRSPTEVESEQYQEFYKHLAHDWEPPLAWKHFRIEGTQMFAGLLFLPRRRPFDLFEAQTHHGVHLHVQRVFIMESAEELVPRWLRFLRGVIDSEDLPLNVSREVLQDSRAVRIIRKQVVHQTLELLEELARDRSEDYRLFFQNFGAVLKEGLHFEPEHKERLAKLLLFASTHGEELVSLDAYVERCPAGQKAIYYLAGATRDVVQSSPHLEKLRQRGYEVLLMTDPVDPFAMAVLQTYREKPLVSAMDSELELGQPEPSDTQTESSDQKHEASQLPTALRDRFQSVLSGKVSEVRPSNRLTDSPACLVVPTGGLNPHVERMLRATRQFEAPLGQRILEVNPEHLLVKTLAALEEQEPDSERVREWIRVLYDQALLAEGSPVDDPAWLARRVSELLTVAVRQAADPAPATG
ncbi:molecular chaperone HtpG [Myxococcota bacterium]